MQWETEKVFNIASFPECNSDRMVNDLLWSTYEIHIQNNCFIPNSWRDMFHVIKMFRSVTSSLAFYLSDLYSFLCNKLISILARFFINSFCFSLVAFDWHLFTSRVIFLLARGRRDTPSITFRNKQFKYYNEMGLFRAYNWSQGMAASYRT